MLQLVKLHSRAARCESSQSPNAAGDADSNALSLMNSLAVRDGMKIVALCSFASREGREEC